MDFNRASDYIVQRLQTELSPFLFYHCFDHTLDVLDAARRINQSEGIDNHSKVIIETAALFHDSGMLVQYKDHESQSVILARQSLPGFGYKPDEIDEISELIMATKLPQCANHLHEQILCDADLDYLGRNDFFINSFKLRLEWHMNGIRSTSLAGWFSIQVAFLTEHHYFTKSTIALRNEHKLCNLSEIRQLCDKSKTG